MNIILRFEIFSSTNLNSNQWYYFNDIILLEKNYYKLLFVDQFPGNSRLCGWQSFNLILEIFFGLKFIQLGG